MGENDERSGVSRRTVLKTSAGAVGAASLAGGTGMLANVEDIEDKNAKQGFEWDSVHDLVIIGSGGAGESAAAAAAREGADAVILERLDTFGGDTRHSSGIMHFGATSAMEEHGHDEDPENYYNYLSPRIGELGSDPHIRQYAANSADHFEWLLDQGVTYGDPYVVGAELTYPYRELAEPMPHAHQVQDQGAELWEELHESAVDAGAEHISGAEVQNLVRGDGRIVGVAVEINGDRQYYKGESGVIIAAGGFEANERMMEQHLPEYLGNPSLSQGMHLGHGHQMGVSAGADTMNMSQSWGAIYLTPAEMKNGILVNPYGQRFVQEDHYAGEIGRQILNRPNWDTAYHIVDDETAQSALEDVTEWDNIGYAEYNYVGEAASVDEISSMTDIPADSLNSTIELYNENAAEGEDPTINKHEDYLKPLGEPYHIYEIPGDTAIYISWGGLVIDTETRVLNPYGEWIEGLYAAGRTATGMAFDGYDSGMSLADITFHGRIAGKIATQGEDAHPYTETLDLEDEVGETTEELDEDEEPPYLREVEEWLADDDSYDEVRDFTGEDEVTVAVGAQGNEGSNAFDPSAIEVSPGTTVVWEWTGEGLHDVVAEDESFATEITNEEGATFEYTFDEEGVHRYYCSPHFDVGMRGAVVVIPE